MKKILATTILTLSIGLLSACGNQKLSNEEKVNENDSIEVIASFYPMYEFAKAVVGDEGEVELLIPAGIEPHEFEPSAKDMTRVSNADAFVYNSNMMEKWAVNGLDSINQDQTKIIEAAKEIHLSPRVSDSADNKNLDPHVWLDPVLAIKEVKEIEKGLVEKFPNKAEAFRKNSDAFIKELSDLDSEFHSALDGAKQRSFITQHAAFGYLAKEYNLNQEPISGISPEEEPSAGRLAELKKFIEDNNINVIYFEDTSTSTISDTLAGETGVRTQVMSSLESVSEEDMDQGVNYISLMEKNLKSLSETIK